MINNIPLIIENDGLLSKQQISALHWAAVGKTAYETASILGCSQRTVKGYLADLYETFNVSNKAQLIAQAFARGYLRAANLLLLIAVINSSSNINNEQLRARRLRKEHPAFIEIVNNEDWL